jgi:hypothetical protein
MTASKRNGITGKVDFIHYLPKDVWINCILAKHCIWPSIQKFASLSKYASNLVKHMKQHYFNSDNSDELSMSFILNQITLCKNEMRTYSKLKSLYEFYETMIEKMKTFEGDEFFQGLEKTFNTEDDEEGLKALYVLRHKCIMYPFYYSDKLSIVTEKLRLFNKIDILSVYSKSLYGTFDILDEYRNYFESLRNQGGFNHGYMKFSWSSHRYFLTRIPLPENNFEGFIMISRDNDQKRVSRMKKICENIGYIRIRLTVKDYLYGNSCAKYVSPEVIVNEDHPSHWLFVKPGFQYEGCTKCKSKDHEWLTCDVELCKICESTGHAHQVCPEAKCKNCGKTGHVTYICPSKRIFKKKKASRRKTIKKTRRIFF